MLQIDLIHADFRIFSFRIVCVEIVEAMTIESVDYLKFIMEVRSIYAHSYLIL